MKSQSAIQMLINIPWTLGSRIFVPNCAVTAFFFFFFSFLIFLLLFFSNFSVVADLDILPDRVYNGGFPSSLVGWAVAAISKTLVAGSHDCASSNFIAESCRLNN